MNIKIKSRMLTVGELKEKIRAGKIQDTIKEIEITEG